jgi:hypothetical protein
MYHKEWEIEEVESAVVNVLACAYNAAVNSGTERGIRKMNDLIEAINVQERIQGREKLKALVAADIIESFNPCPPECEVYRGGLRHAPDCENDYNHPIYRARQEKAQELLPGGKGGNGGWYAASVSLVGHPELNTYNYYQMKNWAGWAKALS